MKELSKTKNASMIAKHFVSWPKYPFTGSKSLEGKFIATLNPEQKETYKRAKKYRLDIAKKFRTYGSKLRDLYKGEM
jgi:hypothetical protein